MNKVLISLFILLVLSALGWRLANDLEQYEKTIYRQPSKEAREDPYLAFRRWMTSNGVHLDENAPDGFPDSFRLNTYDDYDAVLVNLEYYENCSIPPNLASWLKNGGHLSLFITGDVPEDSLSSLWASLQSWTGWDVTTSGTAEIAAGKIHDLMGDEGVEGRVSMFPEQVFFSPALPRQSTYVTGPSDASYYYLSLPFGNGRLTLSGSTAYLENEYIGELDNPKLAWNLAGGAEYPRKVLFLMQSPGKIDPGSKRWTIPVLISALIALALVFWSGSRRPESLLAPSTVSGSDIGIRLTAEGDFFRRYGSTGIYVAAGRAAALRKLRRRGWKKPACADSLNEIAERTGLPAADLLLALGEQTDLSPAEYLRVMKTLHTIEAQL